MSLICSYELINPLPSWIRKSGVEEASVDAEGPRTKIQESADEMEPTEDKEGTEVLEELLRVRVGVW